MFSRLSKPLGSVTSSSRKQRGFTLVELLVVIAIIGVLVALLLPAVQAAREAARRLQCKNKVRQIALAVLNHESAIGTFPTGGSVPWPCVEHHVKGSTANGAARQGLSWAFQVLPYLEQGAVHGITTTEQMESSPVSLYFCPSRRGPTQSVAADAWLIDYASATTGNLPDFENDLYFNAENSFYGCGHLCIRKILAVTKLKGYEYMGVIVRTDWSVGSEQLNCNVVNDPSDDKSLGNTPPVRMAMIEDGTSNTLLIGEKRLASSRYDTGDWHDDKGWADGWDPDTIRSTAFPLKADAVTPEDDPEMSNSGNGESASNNYGFCFGSAHPGGINMSFADGSVHTLNYDIEPEILDDLGNRSDGAIVDLGNL